MGPTQNGPATGTRLVQPSRGPGVLVGVRLAPALLALALAALVLPNPRSPAAIRASACSPPALGFGAGEGLNAAQMPPTVGKLRIAMLFVDFSDSAGPESPQSLFDRYSPSIVDWYRGVSYGRLEIEVEPLPRWLRLPDPPADYESRNFEGAIEATVAAADRAFDFRSFNALYVVAAMPALASTIIDDVPLRLDGTAIHSWAWLATGSLQRLRLVAIHETGHILGLPDLYRNRSASSQHTWDVMTGGERGGMFAWHRWKLGWLEANQIVCLSRRGTSTATIGPIESAGGTKAIVSRVGRTVVVVEVRGAQAEDASLCRTGVLVYRVDFAAGSPEKAGLRQLPIRLRPARPDDPRRWDQCGREWRAPFGRGRGQVSRTKAWNHSITVLKNMPDGSYRVRLTRRA